MVTIDGPAGSGKGTISKLVSHTLDFHYLDSGAIYRIIAFEAKTKNLFINQITQILKLVDGFTPTMHTSGGVANDALIV